METLYLPNSYLALSIDFVPSVTFLVATILMIISLKRFGSSMLGSVFAYLLYGTVIFFSQTIFQKLGASFFEISENSVVVWSHILFYIAIIFYFYGLRNLVLLTNAAAPENILKVGGEKKWGALATISLLVIFLTPSYVDKYLEMYTTSLISDYGLHHFLALGIAGAVGIYLGITKKKLGNIGHAIATPMTAGIWILTFRELVHLGTYSWNLFSINNKTVLYLENLVLTLAALTICYAAIRLNKFTKA